MSIAQPGVVAPWRAAYVPGDWYVIAGPTSLVVLEPGQGRADMIGDLWADVVASSSMTDLIDRLAGYGITELPDLAVVFWSSAGMRTLVRGGVQLDDASTGETVADGAGVVTWNEVGLGELDEVRIRVRDHGTDGEELPLAVGVVRAGALRLSAAESAAVRSPQPLLPSADGAGGSGDVSVDQERPVVGVAAAAAGIAIGAGALAHLDAGATGDDHKRAGDPLAAAGAGEQPDRASGDEQPDDSRPADQYADEGQPDEGQDQFHGAPTAASGTDSLDDDTGPDFPPLDAADDPVATGSMPMSGLDSPWGPQPSVGVGLAGAGLAGVGAPGPAGGGLAGGAALVGDAAGVATGAAHEDAGGGGDGDAASNQEDDRRPAGSEPGDDETTNPDGAAPEAAEENEFSLDQFEMENDDTQLMSSPVVVGPDGRLIQPGQPAPTGPMIEAVRCPQGHPNQPGSTTCRVCRMAITATGSEPVPQPLLARLRAADGTVVELDRAVLLGRAPSELRSTVSLPRLVTLASAAQDISRTHLQVAPDNWQILVTDLNSTNGTFVTDPGPDGNRGLLTPGQPTPVPIGAVLELGEGVTITIEPGD